MELFDDPMLVWVLDSLDRPVVEWMPELHCAASVNSIHMIHSLRLKPRCSLSIGLASRLRSSPRHGATQCERNNCGSCFQKLWPASRNGRKTVRAVWGSLKRRNFLGCGLELRFCPRRRMHLRQRLPPRRWMGKCIFPRLSSISNDYHYHLKNLRFLRNNEYIVRGYVMNGAKLYVLFNDPERI